VAAHPHVGGLVPQDRTDGDTEHVSLLEGQDEGTDLFHPGPGVETGEGVGPAGAGPHLTEHPGELLG
jgi:hypothetical protein